jgi:hypothetical protein
MYIIQRDQAVLSDQKVAENPSLIYGLINDQSPSRVIDPTPLIPLSTSHGFTRIM